MASLYAFQGKKNHHFEQLTCILSKKSGFD